MACRSLPVGVNGSHLIQVGKALEERVMWKHELPLLGLTLHEVLFPTVS